MWPVGVLLSGSKVSAAESPHAAAGAAAVVAAKDEEDGQPARCAPDPGQRPPTPGAHQGSGKAHRPGFLRKMAAHVACLNEVQLLLVRAPPMLRSRSALPGLATSRPAQSRAACVSNGEADEGHGRARGIYLDTGVLGNPVIRHTLAFAPVEA